ncbi:MAG TPA: hypothetical protein VGK67_36095 [Myxococcales bacterium]
MAIAASCAALLGGCRSSVAPLELDVGGDAGTCAQYVDLSCVNYLRFAVSADHEFSTQCVKVTEVLESLCDVPKLADGRALFTMDPDQEVEIEVTGMRVYPATSCESGSECPSRTIFSGHTQKFRLGDFAGQPIPLGLTLERECGPVEQFFPFPNKKVTSCFEVCGAEPVCTFSDGCLCRPL